VSGGVTGLQYHWGHKYIDLVLKAGSWTEPKEVKTESNPAESSKEGYGSKRDVLLIIIIIILLFTATDLNNSDL
jgi:hypothetical protein